MPELPEVETVRRQLVERVVGCRVTGVELVRSDMVVFEGRRRGVRALLRGAVIERVERKGKLLAIVGNDGGALAVHLGMTGSLVVREHVDGPRAHEHVRWRLSRDGAGAGELIFRDVRRFGGIWAFDSFDLLVRARFDPLGPDALGVRDRDLRALRASARPIKAALLDQRVLAGVGNIYADESLFAAGVRPRRRCCEISDEEWPAIASSVRNTLRAAIAGGGSSDRDYTDATGARGGYQREHMVYGRGGRACVRCGRALKSAVVAQRTTVWCGACQR